MLPWFHQEKRNHPNKLARREVLQLLAQLAGGLACGALLGGCAREIKRPWIGDTFPDFELQTPDGSPIRRTGFAGRALIVNFWATWCPPCRREMADLESLYGHADKDKWTLLGISVDSDVNLVKEFLLKEKLSFPIAIDVSAAWSNRALQVPGFPTTYLVGADGKIKDGLIGPRAWAEEAVRTGILKKLEVA